MTVLDPAPPPSAASGRLPRAFFFLVSLFFMWGFITALNDILLPHVKRLFDLSYFGASLVQFSFFIAYGVVGIPSGFLVERLGHRTSIVVALVVMGMGCLLFVPAARFISYPVFLAALFVLASGIVVLQTAANPFVALVGNPESAATRLNLSQAVNSLGHTIAPSLGAFLILRDSEGLSVQAAADAVRMPYVGLAVVLILLAVFFAAMRLPAVRPERHVRGNLMAHRPLVLGAVAIFLYVGAEVSIGSYLVNFFTQPDIAGLTEEVAGYRVSLYWGGAMVGRFAGALLMLLVPGITAQRLLGFNAVAAILLVLATVVGNGESAMWTILAVGFFNSVMFANIFTLAIAGLGELTSRASGALVMAICGGAIVPLLQAELADRTSLQASFLVPAACYIYILFYGWIGWRPARSIVSA